MFVVVWYLALCLGCLVLCGHQCAREWSVRSHLRWGLSVVCRDVLYAVFYVRVSCFVVRGCGVSRRYIDVCYCDMFSVVNVYLDHLRFCVVCINSRRYVCCSECDVVSNECNEPTSCLVQPMGAHCCEVMYFGWFGFRGELGFLNCDDVCMCVVNKQFELLEFVSKSVYVDLQYDEISLTFTAVCLCSVSSPVVVLGLFVRLW